MNNSTTLTHHLSGVSCVRKRGSFFHFSTIFEVNTIILTLLLLFCPVAFLNSVFAEGFGVSPVKLFFNPGATSGLLTVENDGAGKVDFQVEAVRWRKDADGKDQYEATDAIVFFPKIGSVEKGKERIIRVGYRGKLGPKEDTYRLLIRQISVPTPGESGIQFKMILSVPVFIRPEKEIHEANIGAVKFEKGEVLFQINNGGNSHFIVPKIEATGYDDSQQEVFKQEIGGWYVLAGKAEKYVLKIQGENCQKAKEIKVHVALDWEVGDKPFESRQFTIHPEKAECPHAGEKSNE